MHSFLKSTQYFITSESVTEGHPDKMCDQIADAVLDAYIAKDPESRVACEVVATGGIIFIIGEITSNAQGVNVENIAREVIRKIGYTSSEFSFDYHTCGVIQTIRPQAPEINKEVVGKTAQRNRGKITEDRIKKLGAGDQGMMIGFACKETNELMPLPIVLAHRLTKRLAEVRKKGIIPYIYPDGKAQVAIEYSSGKAVRIDKINLVTQHSASVVEKQGDKFRINRKSEKEIINKVILDVIPSNLIDSNTKLFVNPTAGFVIGGPMADSGLTGRKIIVDTYGGFARHGGGSFSGKDPTKVDRSGAYMARYVAKNLVAANLADIVEVQISYANGLVDPFSVMVETFGTAKINEDKIKRKITQNFDFRPGAIIKKFDLWRPIYLQTATYGHFGRNDLNLPWEKTDMVQRIKS